MDDHKAAPVSRSAPPTSKSRSHDQREQSALTVPEAIFIKLLKLRIGHMFLLILVVLEVLINK